MKTQISNGLRTCCAPEGLHYRKSICHPLERLLKMYQILIFIRTIRMLTSIPPLKWLTCAAVCVFSGGSHKQKKPRVTILLPWVIIKRQKHTKQSGEMLKKRKLSLVITSDHFDSLLSTRKHKSRINKYSD